VDGATQESYEKYRVGGTLSRVLGNMQGMLNYRKERRKRKPKIIWQYILFEWNDSEEEIQSAKEMAVDMEVDVLLWVLTHTDGASQRFTVDSGATPHLLRRDGFGRTRTRFHWEASASRSANEWGHAASGSRLRILYRHIREQVLSWSKDDHGSRQPKPMV